MCERVCVYACNRQNCCRRRDRSGSRSRSTEPEPVRHVLVIAESLVMLTTTTAATAAAQQAPAPSNLPVFLRLSIWPRGFQWRPCGVLHVLLLFLLLLLLKTGHTRSGLYILPKQTKSVGVGLSCLSASLPAACQPASLVFVRSAERPERSRGRYGRVQSGNMTASSCSSSNGSSLFGLAVPLAPRLPHAARATAQANRLKSTRKSGRNQKENSNCAPAES